MRRKVLWLVAASMGCSLATTCPAQPGVRPGPEHRVLQEMVGTWDAAMTMGPESSQGVMTFRMDLGDLWLLSNFEGELGGMKFQGHGIDGYDPAKQKYVSVWVDSWTPAISRMEGDWNEQDRTLTMVGETLGPDGNMMKTRMVTTIRDKDVMEFKMYGAGPDGGEMEMMTIEYRRRS